MGIKQDVIDMDAAIIADKKRGLSDIEIGKKYGITYRQLEKIIRQATGVSVSAFNHKKEIKSLFPKDFKEETTTIWSFKSRGNWATHSGEYRGNWSPYIPRNIILKYSKSEETVLDYFCGAGTTAVEAKLLGRKCIALDINDKAIELAKQNIDFKIPIGELHHKIYEPELFVGDARDLPFLRSNSIDLICAHPPYANIIHYTDSKESDLSFLDIKHFLKEMENVAKESYRVLKAGRQCAILIGDMRRHKHVIPLGFELINVYLKAGFRLREIVIKRQHNCKTTGFWHTNSIKFNFLLLGHEYLPIFEKPIRQVTEVMEEITGYGLLKLYQERPLLKRKLEEMETTTVWIFSEDNFERLLNKNIIERYAHESGYEVINIGLGSKKTIPLSLYPKRKKNLLFIKSSCLNGREYANQDVDLYIRQLRDILQNGLSSIGEGGYYVIQTKDVRVGNYIEPLAKRIVDSIYFPEFILKEIVVTVKNQRDKQKETTSDLHISHQYLLIYKKSE